MEGIVFKGNAKSVCDSLKAEAEEYKCISVETYIKFKKLMAITEKQIIKEIKNGIQNW